jgi:hypothetical protein
VVIVKLESFEGKDTFLRCGDDARDYLFTIITIEPDGTAEVIDSGYRTFDEAAAAWPEARPDSPVASTPKRPKRRTRRM